MDSTVQPNTYIAIKLPSDAHKILQITPNTNVSLGKYGSFPANHLIGRPYHVTFEILDGPPVEGGSVLRIVPAVELYEHIKAEAPTPDATANGGDGVEYEVVNAEGKVVMRTNQHIVDDVASQKLSAAEIEALKQGDTSSGKDIIAKILESHSALDKKTSFALAKYTLRKTKKFMKRFTVLPMDVTLLANWMLHEKDASKIMDIREEILALMCSLSNVHCGTSDRSENEANGSYSSNSNRWLAVDETGGLIVAAMAERMGILHKRSATATISHPDRQSDNGSSEIVPDVENNHEPPLSPDQASAPIPNARTNTTIHSQESAMSATSNSITLVHANPQPNLWLLQHFGFEVSSPDVTHPLHTHLRTISWLQLLHPEEDTTYREPELLPDDALATLKSSKKGLYYRKRRRWARVKAIVDQTRAGGFEGLLVASYMAPASILHHLVPLLKGSAQVVVYSPSIEPLTELMDCYSKLRRAAFLNTPEPSVPSEDFPLNPFLLLAPSVQTCRARPWQVLPGRTHPRMTSRGGSEGYLFSATRVLPIEGKVEGRGAFGNKKRKVDKGASGQGAAPTVTVGTMELDGEKGKVVKVEDEGAVLPNEGAAEAEKEDSSTDHAKDEGEENGTSAHIKAEDTAE